MQSMVNSIYTDPGLNEDYGREMDPIALMQKLLAILVTEWTL